MTAVVRGDALRLPLRDESVDLIVTSPPYFALRSYRDGGEHYDGQIGSEPTPQAFLDALWAVTAECWRVLKPSGSMFVNLGDKRSGSGGHNNAGLSTAGSTLEGTRQQYRTGGRHGATSIMQGRAHAAERDSTRAARRNAPDRYTQAAFGRAKSKMLLPHRYAIGCEDGQADPDGIGWIVRQDLVWSKPNGLPESVKDRTRDAHEYWFHLVKRGDYFAAVDEIREPHKPQSLYRSERARFASDLSQDGVASPNTLDPAASCNPLGALPRSVWEIATEPLKVPEHLGVDHFAAFPSEWPRRLILGFSPSGICTACGEGRFNETEITGYVCACTPYTDHPERRRKCNNPTSGMRVSGMTGGAKEWDERQASNPGPVREYHFNGWTPAETRPAVVLDPFGGTGTTAMVARALGRTGISVDLSADYCRLAKWRIFESGHGAKAAARTNRDRQGVLL